MAHAVRIFQMTDVSGYYLAPVPLEFPGKSGDSFIPSHPTHPIQWTGALDVVRINWELGGERFDAHQ